MKYLSRFGVLFIISATALFAGGPYIGAGVGYLVNTKEAMFNGRIGFDVVKQSNLTHSAEVEVLYSSEKDYGVTQDLTSILANYKLTVDTPSKVYVAVGAGAGSTHVRIRTYWFSMSDQAFTYQLLGSVGYRFTERFSLEVSERYLKIGNVSFFNESGQIGDDTSTEIGLKYKF